MKTIFNRPYPYTPTKKLWRQSFVIGLFVFLFLLIFQPFGLNKIQGYNILYITLGYGIISAFVTIIFSVLPSYLFKNYHSEERWTIAKEVIHNSAIILSICLANYLYTHWLGFGSFSLKGFFVMAFQTLAISSIIITVIISFATNRVLKQHLREAQKMNDRIQEITDIPKTNSEELLTLESEVEKQNITLQASALVYLSSDGNYIDVFYLNSEEEVKSARIRNRMKIIEENIQSYSYLFRCHRAFIVNKNYIKSVEGNAKGYTIYLRKFETAIPVSRSKSKELKALLDQ